MYHTLSFRPKTAFSPPFHLAVSRPLFIEEHGLRALLDQSGVGVELARTAYEDGDWAAAVSEALAKGASRKARKRREMARGVGVDTREREGKRLAASVTRWVRGWWAEQPPAAV